MKKVLLVLVVCLICLTSVSCDTPSKSILERGDEIISIVSDMVASDEYIEAMSGGASAYDELISEVKTIDFSKIATVYELNIPEKETLKKLSRQNFDMDKMPQSVIDKLYLGIGSSLASYINGKGGSDSLVVATFFSAGKCFVDKSITHKKHLLYAFESGHLMLISFVPREDGAVSASSHFILNDEFLSADAKQISESFEEFGLDGITITKIK